MKKGILVVGPRGSGKSTWTQHIKEHHPEVTVFSRDQFFAEHFSDGFDPYSGMIRHAAQQFWEWCSEQTKDKEGTFVFDYFTGWTSERTKIGHRLRASPICMNVVTIDLLITSQERTVRQYAARPGMKEQHLTEREGLHDFKLFWENVSDIFPDNDTRPHVPYPFDGVRLISLDQLVLPGTPLH